ncbi:MAG: DUF1552 domain-containing protein [Acidobacteria bacterium]|nr:DUF1552 domain-containing protein [Acidobacteriota bacterium]
MFISKKHISRRTVLRGMGAAVTLPFLEAMVPAMTPLRQTPANPRTRLACIEVVHGSAGSTQWGTETNILQPVKAGRDFDFTPILKPFEPFRDYTTIVSMMDCHTADPYVPEEVGADHFRSSAVFLSAAHPKQTMGSDVYNGTTIDQMYAQKFGQDTPVPSIQLCTENEDASGSCAFNYSCVYMQTISWSSPTTPLQMTYNPRMAFEELFGTGFSEKDRASRRRINRSILDGITHDIARLQKNLNPSDRGRLDSYLENVREIERRIQAIEAYNTNNPEREIPTAPIGVPDSWDELAKLMIDLQVLAFMAETTRVSTFKLGRDTSNRVFPESGSTSPFHSASHHGDTPSAIREFAKINTYHASLLAEFVQKLKNTPDGDGNLLDHSLVLYGSGMGNSNVHAHKRVPFVLVGHASGAVKGNLHVVCKEETPQANGLLAVLHKLGVNVDSIGDSTEPVAI